MPTGLAVGLALKELRPRLIDYCFGGLAPKPWFPRFPDEVARELGYVQRAKP